MKHIARMTALVIVTITLSGCCTGKRDTVQIGPDTYLVGPKNSKILNDAQVTKPTTWTTSDGTVINKSKE